MIAAKHQKIIDFFKNWLGCLVCFGMLMSFTGGCAVAPQKLVIKDLAADYDQGTIISTQSNAAVSFEDLITDLSQVQVVYVGEQHRNAAHHKIQLDIIKALFAVHPDIAVGMEMSVT